MFDRLLQWDRDTFIYLNALGIDDYDVLWTTITHFTTWIPLFLLMIALFFIKFERKLAFQMVLTVLALALFVAILTSVSKEVVQRLRPNNNEALNGLIRILQRPTDFSFFSGHASSSFSITVLVVLFLFKRWKWAVLFFVWPLLFSLSRIFVGVHFPLDIIAGALVGTTCGLLGFMVYNRFIAPYSKSDHPE
ncbi:MAG: phosphatase PAP2 family protein [Croceitalea sp.]|nr:phosphatase PAP2 family protein [Croceitalea sp.]MBT8237456.1 phosphatase PAP2 family protein [Croceitalea sp.]NNL09717.1 phosphatase PAP2 family protein [Croceitalea sp.]